MASDQTRLAAVSRGDGPPPRSMPVTVVVLTRDEEANIARCLASVEWAEQTVVVDSGSTDKTVPIARSLGADVVQQPWLGFSGQREFALRLAEVRNDWIYFVDADEWVSPQLASEIAAAAARPRLRGLRPPLPCGFPGLLDTALRLVRRIMDSPACRPSLHEVRRKLSG